MSVFVVVTAETLVGYGRVLVYTIVAVQFFLSSFFIILPHSLRKHAIST